LRRVLSAGAAVELNDNNGRRLYIEGKATAEEGLVALTPVLEVRPVLVAETSEGRRAVPAAALSLARATRLAVALAYVRSHNMGLRVRRPKAHPLAAGKALAFACVLTVPCDFEASQSESPLMNLRWLGQ
jgi:hypothetical protein